MSIDCTLELQGAILAHLKADPAVSALVNGRIYDTVPPETQFPYISFGPVDDNEEDADCIYSSMVYQQIDVWSRDVGYPEVKRIAGAVRAALHDKEVELALTENALADIRHRQTTTVRDPDGLTNHSIMGFEALIERR
jgi:hypothetical protein